MFTITQHSRDEQLMKSLVNYWGFGRYVARDGEHGELLVTDIEAVTNKVIPLFSQYPIVGIKSKDFHSQRELLRAPAELRRRDFKQVALLIQNKDHLTIKGLEKIRKIKAGMNKGRIN